MIPIRIPWAEKPPLGTPLRTDGHWSTWDLAGAWLFNEGGGLAPQNLGSGYRGTISISAPATEKYSQTGISNTANSSIGVSIPTTVCPLLFDVTVKGKFTRATQAGIIDLFTASTRPLQASYLDTNILRVSSVHEPSGTSYVSSIAIGDRYAANKIRISILPNRRIVYVNDVIVEDIATSGGLYHYNITGLYLARDSSGYSTPHDIEYCIVYHSPLSANLDNPWIIAEPRTLWIPEAIAAGGFKPYWARHRTQILGGGLR